MALVIEAAAERQQQRRNAQLLRPSSFVSGGAACGYLPASGTADLLPLIDAIRAEGITSATGIAKALNERGIPAT